MYRVLALLACLLVAACSGDDDGPARGESKHRSDAGAAASVSSTGNAQCPDGVYGNSAYIETTETFDALHGCTRIAGDLTISSESFTDLRGLEALTTVDGTFQIAPSWASDPAGADTLFNRLDDLSGLEGLRQVGALVLNGLGVTTLTPLAQLKAAERIELVQLDGLEDLSGLERVEWSEIRVSQNARLRDLSGLRVPEDSSMIELSSDPALESISALSALREVDQLILQDLPALSSLDGLAELKRIAIELIIKDLGALTDLSDLGAVGPSLTISDNENLKSLTGRADRGTLRGVVVWNNPQLETLAGLLGEKTTHLDSLVLMQLPQLHTIEDLSPLTEIGDMGIHTCVSLYDLTGLENLKVLSSISIINTAHLRSLAGMKNLERIDAGLYLNSMPELESLQGMDKLQSISNLMLNSLNSVTDLHGLEAIHELDDIEIAANASLASFEGLNNLTRASKVLIANNDALATLSGLDGLASVSGLQLTANTALSTLRELEALTSASALSIAGNQSLPECEVEWLAGRLSLPKPEGQNGPEGVCAK